MPTDVERHRGRLAIRTRYKGPNAPETLEARRALQEAVLEARIRKLVDAAPPLSPEQRDRLALLLKGGQAPLEKAG